MEMVEATIGIMVSQKIERRYVKDLTKVCVLLEGTANMTIGVWNVGNLDMEHISAEKEEITHKEIPMTLTEIDRTSTQTRVIGSITTAIEVQVITR